MQWQLCITGDKLEGLTNFIKLKIQQDRGIFEYEVRYEPNVHCREIRQKLLNANQAALGNTRTFDGTMLCLPHKLNDRITKLATPHPTENCSVEMTIIFKRKRNYSEDTQFYGILFHRIMRVLKFVQHKNKAFDPTDPKIIPQHKLEIWPGYVIAVEDCDGGVILCVDVASRVLRQERLVYNHIHHYP